jgi:hypothetical protein
MNTSDTRNDTIPLRQESQRCIVLLLSEPIEGVDIRGEKNYKYSQDHGVGDRCGESVGILYSSAAENWTGPTVRETFCAPPNL